MDQRGYGRTTGWEPSPTHDSAHDADLSQYTFTNLVRDLVCLVYKLGYPTVHCILGHDFGAVSSAMAALMRPDIFRSTIQMSHPHHAPPQPPFGPSAHPASQIDIQADLAKLTPPRKHYKFYNSAPAVATDWNNPPQGLYAYLRGYFPPEIRRLGAQQAPPSLRLVRGSVSGNARILHHARRAQHAANRCLANGRRRRVRNGVLALARGSRGLLPGVVAHRVPGGAEMVSRADCQYGGGEEGYAVVCRKADRGAVLFCEWEGGLGELSAAEGVGGGCGGGGVFSGGKDGGGGGALGAAGAGWKGG
ncbi:hypothetical protein LTR82_007892 [Friedmanniomyces endolithicus]|nr:hypothetical protein LTR82_007892 [Friedmanniomyces endolithicus]